MKKSSGLANILNYVLEIVSYRYTVLQLFLLSITILVYSEKFIITRNHTKQVHENSRFKS